MNFIKTFLSASMHSFVITLFMMIAIVMTFYYRKKNHPLLPIVFGVGACTALLYIVCVAFLMMGI